MPVLANEEALPATDISRCYYDPATGQFLTRDPAVAQTREPYGYTGNISINRTDPTGMDWWDPRDNVLPAIGEAAQDTGEFVVRNRHTIIDVGASFATAAVCTGAFAACVVGFGAMTVGGTGLHVASDAIFDDEHNISLSNAVSRSALSSGGGALCGLTFGRGCFGATAAGPKLAWTLPGPLGGRLWPALFMSEMFVLKQGVLALDDRLC